MPRYTFSNLFLILTNVGFVLGKLGVDIVTLYSELQALQIARSRAVRL